MAWIPKYIHQAEAKLTRDRVSSYYWNSLFNRIIDQGDYNSELLNTLLNTNDYSVGPAIVDEADVSFGRTPFLKFLNTEITIDGDYTIINGVTGPEGPTGPAGPEGAIGPTGPSGNDFTLLGIYATLEALETAQPTGEAGDAYAVGDETSNTVYIWSTVESAWVDIGGITGPQGIQGIQGIPGPEGPEGPEGPAGDTGALIPHLADAVSHITGMERTAWNAKSNLTLGELVTNAYRGDRGKIAYDHSQALHQAVINGAATTIVAADLAVSRALVSDAGGKVAVSAVTAAQLGYLGTLASDVQTQINGKLGASAQAADSLKVGGKKLTVGTVAPTSPAVGDLWVDTN